MSNQKQRWNSPAINIQQLEFDRDRRLFIERRFDLSLSTSTERAREAEGNRRPAGNDSMPDLPFAAERTFGV